jgi:hypothetical protein
VVEVVVVVGVGVEVEVVVGVEVEVVVVVEVVVGVGVEVEVVVGVVVVVVVVVEVGVRLRRGGEIMGRVASPLSVGKAVLIRTVTHYYTGRVAQVKAHEIVLRDAAWIADTDRFHDALKTGTLSEVEPFVGPVSVNRDALVDVTEWKHALPREQK